MFDTGRRQENARKRQFWRHDPKHIRGPLSSSILRQMEQHKMYLIDGLIVLAMIFFFVLPITDAKTVRMKLSVVGSLGVLLAVSVVVPRLIQ